MSMELDFMGDMPPFVICRWHDGVKQWRIGTHLTDFPYWAYSELDAADSLQRLLVQPGSDAYRYQVFRLSAVKWPTEEVTA